MGERGWSCLSEQRQRKQPQANAHCPHLQTQKFTHTSTADCVYGVCVFIADAATALVVWIYYKYWLTMDDSTSRLCCKALSQQYVEKWLFISAALQHNKLWTIDCAPVQSNMEAENKQTEACWAACWSIVNTCNNKDLPVTKKQRKIPPINTFMGGKQETRDFKGLRCW